jgi:hypothetical protein
MKTLQGCREAVSSAGCACIKAVWLFASFDTKKPAVGRVFLKLFQARQFNPLFSVE